MQNVAVDKLRNVALVSHGGTGKTSLAEAMLFATGATTRLGKVEEGNTASDYEPEEIKRRGSIQTSVVPCEHRDHKINLLDTPGYVEFIGEVYSALRAADAVIVPVSAPSGVEVGTEITWKLMDERGLPRIIFINRMDRENADFYQCLESVQQRLGKQCVAIQLPIGAEADFTGVVSLLDPDAIPSDLKAQADEHLDKLMEAVAEADDALADKYLDEGTLSREELTDGLKQAILSGSVVPVLAGAATLEIGVKELLDAIVDLLPSPTDMPRVEAQHNGSTESLETSEDGPLVAQIFKTTADPFVGKLSYFRVFSGVFKGNGEVWNADKEHSERIGHVFVPRGKNQDTVDAIGAGDIGAVPKLTTTTTGDTLGQKDNGYTVAPISFPNPTYSVAIHPKSKSDLDKMSSSLARLVEEDPSLRIHRDPDTAETVLEGMGDVHVDVTAERMRRKFGIDPEVTLPKVPYRETIATKTNTEYKHKKQSGGHGQYGHVMITLEPLPSGSGFVFDNKVTGGTVPKEYIPAVEKGVSKSLPEGVLAGYPIVDLKVTLYDGSYHAVDSSGMSFEIAGGMALKQGMEKAHPILLEPILRAIINVPDAFTGEVVGDLNSKRAHIAGMFPGDGLTEIEATVPQSEMRRYAAELRALTQGRGYFTVEFSSYQPVPEQAQQRIVEEAKKEHEAVKA
ncbi:MAG: elongation factor G [Chloroflexi bacterium]|jgi:elongation factor G|nr:MAG: elongation factor G [Chloroflexota bacterium]